MFIFVGVISVNSICFALEYTSSAKATNVIRFIWQLAIKVIVSFVGIETIINSILSASLAAESLQVIKDGDAREHSSHIIDISPVGVFPIDLPQYRRCVSHSLDTKRSIEINNGFISTAIAETQNSKLLSVMSDVGFTVFNSGKRAYLNLEYDFTITNISNFRDYKFNFDGNDVFKRISILLV